MQGQVSAAIDALVARGVFRAARAGEAREGGAWYITWFGGHVMRWEVAEGLVSIEPVLPPLAARSILYRDLRAWLKEQQSPERPEHRRFDPARYTVTLSNRGGRVRLALAGAGEAAPALMQRAVQLVHALYHEFLGGPGRLEWVIEAFELDPDNPRLS